MILNTILKAPGPPDRSNKPKNKFFKKSQNFQKIAKNIKKALFGPGAPGAYLIMAPSDL